PVTDERDVAIVEQVGDGQARRAPRVLDQRRIEPDLGRGLRQRAERRRRRTVSLGEGIDVPARGRDLVEGYPAPPEQADQSDALDVGRPEGLPRPEQAGGLPFAHAVERLARRMRELLERELHGSYPSAFRIA